MVQAFLLAFSRCLARQDDSGTDASVGHEESLARVHPGSESYANGGGCLGLEDRLSVVIISTNEAVERYRGLPSWGGG